MTSDYTRRSETSSRAAAMGYRKLGIRVGKRTVRSADGENDLTENRQTPAESSVCVYVDEDISEDEIRNEDMIELAPRNRLSRMPKCDDSLIKCVEISTKDGDTLTNIALRYNCKVADLKRLNKLIKDQDFFGLKRIYVPVIRHGLLEERLRTEDKENTHNESAICYLESNDNQIFLDEEPDDAGSLPSSDTQDNQAQKLLLRYDQEIQNALTSTRLDPSSSGVDAFIRPPLSRQISKTINWKTVLTFFVTFCVVIPVLGGLYFILRHFMGN